MGLYAREKMSQKLDVCRWQCWCWSKADDKGMMSASETESNGGTEV